MALITCPKCGKQFSEHAEKCPQCGITKIEALKIWKDDEHVKNVRSYVVCAILFLVCIGMLIYIAIA